jgi:hypothetical protein
MVASKAEVVRTAEGQLALQATTLDLIFRLADFSY